MSCTFGNNLNLSIFLCWILFQISRSSDIVTQDVLNPEHRRRLTNLAKSIIDDIPPPQSEVEKPFLLSEGKIHLNAALNKAIYAHGEEILVRVHVRNNSNKTIKRIKVGESYLFCVCLWLCRLLQLFSRKFLCVQMWKYLLILVNKNWIFVFIIKLNIIEATDRTENNLKNFECERFLLD